MDVLDDLLAIDFYRLLSLAENPCLVRGNYGLSEMGLINDYLFNYFYPDD